MTLNNCFIKYHYNQNKLTISVILFYQLEKKMDYYQICEIKIREWKLHFQLKNILNKEQLSD